MKKFVMIMVACLLTLSGSAFAAVDYTVGTNAEFPPFEFFGDDGTIQGFDAELIAAIMAQDGSTFVIESMEFDALPAALEAGKIDIAIAGMTISEEKGKSVLFSKPYFKATQKLIVLEGSDIKTEADLKDGMKVGMQLGTTGDIYVTDNLPQVEPQRYAKALDAIIDMKNGRLDAVMVDAGPSQYFADSVEGLVVLEEDLSDEEYGIAVKLDNTALMDKLNAGLDAIIADGTYDTIFEKYFGKIDTAAE